MHSISNTLSDACWYTDIEDKWTSICFSVLESGRKYTFILFPTFSTYGRRRKNTSIDHPNGKLIVFRIRILIDAWLELEALSIWSLAVLSSIELDPYFCSIHVRMCGINCPLSYIMGTTQLFNFGTVSARCWILAYWIFHFEWPLSEMKRIWSQMLCLHAFFV